MPNLICSENCLDAWQKTCRYLMTKASKESNLLIVIENPILFEKEWLDRYNPYRVKPTETKKNNIRNVINTIFPYKLESQSVSSSEFYEKYKILNERGKRRKINRPTWGTYFERLTYFDGTLNQLERVIVKLKDWPNNQSAAFVFHLSSPDIDSPRRMGAPCWQYAQLSEDDEGLHLTVVYRNHDYFNKALGNFIGLAKLLGYICKRTGKTPGKLVCHSVHAYYAESNTLMNQLISCQSS
jgi:thymidylate synthase